MALLEREILQEKKVWEETDGLAVGWANGSFKLKD